jgi:hypothetical protein
MTGDADLTVWLRAQWDARERQLDDDERVARAAADWGETWRGDDGGIYPSDDSRHPGPLVVGPYGYLNDQHAEHIARFDPARILEEVAAGRADIASKRRIVEQYEAARDQARNPVSARNYEAARVEQGALGDVIRLLAASLAGRPGYEESWRP